MAALGGPSASGIPILVPEIIAETQPTVAIATSGTSVTVSWPVDVTGYTLQSSPTVNGPTWTPVAGVAGNSVTIPATTGNLFLRLIK